MKIGIISDLHLGYRQYGSLEREEDFYTQYLECMNQIHDEGVDYLIIAGDIFDKPNPSPKAMNIYRQGIAILDGITVYTITGNHTMLMRDNHYTVDNYFAESSGINNYNLIDDSIFFTDEFDIAGLIYRSDTDLESFHEVREDLLTHQQSDKMHILVIHQAIKEYCGFTGAKLSIDDLDAEEYDLIICGHIHSPFYTHIDSTIFLQPGSIERMNTTEAQDEIERGKGFFIYDTETEDLEFHKVKSFREFLMGDIEFTHLDEIEQHFEDLRDEIDEMECPPIISYNYYDTTGNAVYIRELMKRLDGVLINNSNVYDLSNEIPEIEIGDGELPTVLEALDAMAKETFPDDKPVELAKEIFNAYDKGNDDSVEGILDNFYQKNYTHVEIIEEDYLEIEKEIEEAKEFFDNLGEGLDV